MIPFTHLLLGLLLIRGADDWQELNLLDLPGAGLIKATSELDSEQDRPGLGQYGIVKAVDKDISTAWVQGRQGSGVGEAIYLLLPEDRKTISLFSGYGKSEELFKKNNRLKQMTLSCLVGINPDGYVSETSVLYQTKSFNRQYDIFLQDTFAVQTFTFPFDEQKLDTFRQSCIQEFRNDFQLPIARTDLILKLEISDVYRGSQWDDTCLSELFFSGLYLHNPNEVRYSGISDIYLNQSENAVLIDTEQGKGITIYQDSTAVLQIIDTSPDNQWLICIAMPADPTEGRTETTYLLFNTFSGRLINHELETIRGQPIYGPLMFNNRGDRLLLEYSTPDGFGSIELH